MVKLIKENDLICYAYGYITALTELYKQGDISWKRFSRELLFTIARVLEAHKKLIDEEEAEI